MRLNLQPRWIALIVLCLGSLMIVLDTTIVNVALPSIRADLGFSPTSLAWVVNAYMLTFGGFLLLGGRLGDLFGHRPLFIGGVILFTAASLACGLSDSQALLVAARAVQGLGGAVVSAVSLSLMMSLFVEPAERARAMGVFGFVAAGGGSIGVLLGGVLTGLLNWHWIFLVNVPIGVAVCLLARRVLPSRDARRGPAATRRGRRRADHHRPDAGRVRDRRRQPGGLDLGADPRAAGRRGSTAGRVRGPRGADRLAAGPARAAAPAQTGGVQRGRRAVGGGDVRLVLPLGVVPAARAAATRRSRWAWPSCRRT